LLIQESNNRVQDNLLIDGRNWQSSAERYGHKGIEQDEYRKENNTAIWARGSRPYGMFNDIEVSIASGG